MAFFKCKMCGGELDIHEGVLVAVCPYCNTKQTLPKLNNKKENLYSRADYFRRNNEYDKAAEIYEKILIEDIEDAEAYWSLVLCRYGIEYVEDSITKRRVPTVNSAQYTSVFLDENYKSAIKYANKEQKAIYELEARDIDKIQKGIIEISSEEEPFDIFICYKENDNNGKRTNDSVYAQEIYDNLTNVGYRVFLSRVTLEEKPGKAYEPYIFAALNSAKIMIVVGTNSEYLNSVWVKNEWSRFLALIKGGEKKTLIPVYKDMSPYELPEEFAYLQAQDMSKVGFMQDLVRGVKKIIAVDNTIASDNNKSASKKKIVIPIISILLVIAISLCGVFAYKDYFYPLSIYNSAKKQYDNGDYQNAIEMLNTITDFKGSTDLYNKCINQMKTDFKTIDVSCLVIYTNESLMDYEKELEIANTYVPKISSVEDLEKCAYDYYGNSEYIPSVETISISNTQHSIYTDECLEWLFSENTKINDCNCFELGSYWGTPGVFILLKTEEPRKPKSGDYIEFGNYNNAAITWKVLDNKENKILLTTPYSIVKKPYNDTLVNTTWENCSLRKWLNNDFYNDAFSENEKYQIVLSEVSGENNLYTGADGGRKTSDKVFILSSSEIEKYIPNRDDRNLFQNDDFIWWTRTVGENQQKAGYVENRCQYQDVFFDGDILYDGIDVNSDEPGVRPAMWLSLKQ